MNHQHLQSFCSTNKSQWAPMSPADQTLGVVGPRNQSNIGLIFVGETHILVVFIENIFVPTGESGCTGIK